MRLNPANRDNNPPECIHTEQRDSSSIRQYYDATKLNYDSCNIVAAAVAAHSVE